MAKQALLKSFGDVDIRLLRVFVVVSACGGITASEFELNIGRSTISRHISDLEARLGLRLCNRGPSGFSLTNEGRQVLELTMDLLGQIDNFRSNIDAIQETLTGTIRLGLYDQSSANPDAHIHEAIAAFDNLAPRVKIELSFDTLTALEAGVCNGKIDLAVVPVFLPNTALKIERLYSETMRLYCGKGHEMFGQETANIAPQDILASHKYAGYAFNSPNMQAGNRLNLTRAADVKDEEALALLVQSGRYIGFLADHYVENAGGRERFWPLFPARLSYDVQFAAIFREQPQPDRKTGTFLECLLQAHNRDRNQRK
jgi:DNA-binding transcriptional LysR family regulator